MVVSPQSLCHCAAMSDLQISIIYAVTLWVKLFDSLRVPPQKSPHSGLTRTTQLEAGKILLDVVNSAKRIVYSLSFPPKLIIIMKLLCMAWGPKPRSSVTMQLKSFSWPCFSRQQRSSSSLAKQAKCKVWIFVCETYTMCCCNCVAQAGDTWEHGWC